MGKTIYRRMDRDRFVKLEVTETISLSRLKRRLERLKAQLDMPEPTDEELIEAGKAVHPYYDEQEQVRRIIGEMEKLLEALENVRKDLT